MICSGLKYHLLTHNYSNSADHKYLASANKPTVIQYWLYINMSYNVRMLLYIYIITCVAIYVATHWQSTVTSKKGSLGTGVCNNYNCEEYL